MHQVDEFIDKENEVTKVYVITREEWEKEAIRTKEGTISRERDLLKY